MINICRLLDVAMSNLETNSKLRYNNYFRIENFFFRKFKNSAIMLIVGVMEYISIRSTPIVIAQLPAIIDANPKIYKLTLFGIRKLL